MKKVLAFFAMVVMMTTLTRGAVAQAAQPELATQPELTVEISDVTVEKLSLDERGARVSYTPTTYRKTFTFRIDGEIIATATEECEVWHYSDGKVHLYTRSISLTHGINYTVTKSYGSIVNTDGSLSYTTGDRVHIYSATGSTWNFAIDFRITPTTAADFSCYGV